MEITNRFLTTEIVLKYENVIIYFMLIPVGYNSKGYRTITVSYNNMKHYFAV